MQSGIKTPLGVVSVAYDDQFLYSLEFVEGSELNDGDVNPIFKSIKSELESYFAGKLQNFDTPIYLNGTEFQKRCWEALLKVPYGQTISYAAQAKSIGRPTAYRAVANANGANPLAIIVPCHRIISSNGSLAGYNYGVDKKRFLLELESRGL